MVQIEEVDSMKLLVKVVQQLSMARDIQTVMKIVRTAARNLTGADGATFVLRDGDLCFYADEDAISPLWKGSRFPMQICISGWSMLNKKAVIIEDIYKDDRIPHAAYRPTFVKSLAMVPIRTLDPIGAIGNYWAEHHLPTSDQMELLQSLADVTAVTIENINVYNELEQRVQQRTAELEAANKDLESFSYSVSHDLRSPLRSIIGFSEIIKEDSSENLNESGVKALNNVIQNANRMNILIDDLLQFSRLHSMPLAKAEIDTHELVSEIVDDLNISNESKVRINVSALPKVKADKSLFRQVWINLITNALKYSSKRDTPVIEISSLSKEGAITFAVKDNGVGFNMEYAGKLFNAFQRLHKASDFPGTGVGLALVRSILKRHGGKVWAEGKVNEGAVFYFSIPE